MFALRARIVGYVLRVLQREGVGVGYSVDALLLLLLSLVTAFVALEGVQCLNFKEPFEFIQQSLLFELFFKAFQQPNQIVLCVLLAVALGKLSWAVLLEGGNLGETLPIACKFLENFIQVVDIGRLILLGVGLFDKGGKTLGGEKSLDH